MTYTKQHEELADACREYLAARKAFDDFWVKHKDEYEALQARYTDTHEAMREKAEKIAGPERLKKGGPLFAMTVDDCYFDWYSFSKASRAYLTRHSRLPRRIRPKC